MSSRLSLSRVFVRLGFRKKVESSKKKSRHLGKYDTPTMIGEKWQINSRLCKACDHLLWLCSENHTD